MNTPTIQNTLILIKPDGLKKSLTGNILTKLAETRLTIVGAKVVRVSSQLAEEHYKELKGKPFFPDLIRYIQGEFHGKEYNRVLAMVYRGDDAIKRVRTIVGATNPEEADSTSIRWSYGRITTKGVYENVIHASANEADSEREIKLWFKPEEVVGDLYPSKKTTHEKYEDKVWS